VSTKKKSVNSHCPVEYCRAKHPHTGDPLIKALVLRYAEPDKLLGWIYASLGQLGMVPIVFGAGILLGLIAWSAQSLIPGMIGHFVMDVGLFAYWWTGILGDFPQHPISETGVDRSFVITSCTFVISLTIVLIAILKLRQKR